MIVVSDTTPLISLMKAGQLNVLHKLFGDILIPQAVFDELTGNLRFRQEAEMIENDRHIHVVAVEERKLVALLQRTTGLDLGESEAIVYADDNHADFLLMDENAGRKVAKTMGLRIMGTVGVLVNACHDKYMTAEEVESAFDRLRKANRHISERIIQDALELIHQS